MTWFTDLVEHHCPSFGAVAEVSAGTPDRTVFAKYCGTLRKVLLVEPGPGFDLLKQKWGNSDNVTLHNVAIDDAATEVDLWMERDTDKHHFNGHTADYPHHEPHDPKIWFKITVPAVPFSTIDPGDIDALMLDVEGSELKVLETMVSKPQIIAVEIRHGDGKHPAARRIMKWMRDHGYKLITRHGWDDVYLR